MTRAGRKVIGAGGAAGRWEDLAIPDAAFSWLEFTIQQKGRIFRPRPDWKITLNRPTGKAYFVATDGNDANSGLDAAHPLRSINTAVKKTDAKIVYVKAGLYGKTYGYINTGVANISVIATDGRATVGAFFEELSWSADETAFTAALVSANTYLVIDASQVDAKGDFSILTNVASAALVKTTPGSWYASGTNVWVRTADSRTPDAAIRIFDKSAFPGAMGKFGAPATYYFEKIDFEGGYHAFYSNSQASAGQTQYFNSCTFKYASRNGYANEGCTVYLLNCESAKNTLDAFNIHKSGSQLGHQVEINCIGRDQIGAADNANNGSTNHDSQSKVVVGGDYSNTSGPTCHDISVGTTNWYLGTKSHDSWALTEAYRVAFMVGSFVGTESTRTWLDSCRGYNSAGGAVRVNAGSTLYVRNFSGSLANAGAGSIVKY